MLQTLIGESSEIRPFHEPARWWELLPALVPPLLILICILYSHPLPHWDYWLVLQQLIAGASDRTATVGPFLFLNEHIQNIPALLFRYNLIVTGGDERALSFLAWCCSLFQFLILLRYVRFSETASVPGRMVLLFILSALCFPVSALFLYFEGSMGVTCLLVSALITMAADLTVRAAEAGSPVSWYSAFVCVLAASLCHASAFLFFPLFFLAGVHGVIPRRHVIITGFALCALFFFWFFMHPRPADHAGMQTASPWAALSFTLAFLGNPFARGSGAIVAGAFLLSAASIFGCSATGTRVSFWKLLALFVLGNSLAAGLMRSGMGIDVALAERYAYMGALLAAALTLHWMRNKHCTGVCLYAWCILVGIWPYAKQVQSLQHLLEFQSVKILSSHALVHRIPDTALFSSVLNPSYPGRFANFPQFIRGIGHTTGFSVSRCQYAINDPAPTELTPASVHDARHTPLGKVNRVSLLHPQGDAPCILFIHRGRVTGVLEKSLKIGSDQWSGYQLKSAANTSAAFLAPAKKNGVQSAAR